MPSVQSEQAGAHQGSSLERVGWLGNPRRPGWATPGAALPLPCGFLRKVPMMFIPKVRTQLGCPQSVTAAQGTPRRQGQHRALGAPRARLTGSEMQQELFGIFGTPCTPSPPHTHPQTLTVWKNTAGVPKGEKSAPSQSVQQQPLVTEHCGAAPSRELL